MSLSDAIFWAGACIGAGLCAVAVAFWRVGKMLSRQYEEWIG